MVTKHEIIGEEWKKRAPVLAKWGMKHLVNRKDVWGNTRYSLPTSVLNKGEATKP
ncbi:MAG: hypothetical protein L3J51_11940 [Cocleimonas sp.]|nr:hypothetical protein [Cocleimonas sp.]